MKPHYHLFTDKFLILLNYTALHKNSNENYFKLARDQRLDGRLVFALRLRQKKCRRVKRAVRASQSYSAPLHFCKFAR